MKYIVILGDGMADKPIEALGGLTPLAYARTPVMDRLSKESEIGMVKTVPEGMKPGSDVANLAVIGYNPKEYYSGRSPLEALSIGVKMEDTDVALRCNIVTLSEEEKPFEELTIVDHSSSEISTEECGVLLETVAKELANEIYQFYVGTSYRHCLIWKNGQVIDLVPPHDVLGQVIAPYLPKEEVLLYMMKRSYEILKDHPINRARREKGLNPANCFWFWGAGTKPTVTDFFEKTGKKGLMVSAVDLLKGIAVGAHMGVAHVPGANGGLHTNYEGKVMAAVKGLTEEGYDFVYVHVEAPDEMGHQGSVERKVQAIEYLDSRVIGPVCDKLDALGVGYRMLILPDHPTPICIRTHSDDAVPYMLFDSTDRQSHSYNYNEAEAAQSGYMCPQGYKLIEKLFQK